LLWAEVTQVRMQPPSVVEHLDVLEDLPPPLLARLEDPFPDQLGLQGGKERLGARVIPAVAPATHALSYPVLPQMATKRPGAVLHPPIGVQLQIPRRSAMQQGHQQGVHRQLRSQA